MTIHKLTDAQREWADSKIGRHLRAVGRHVTGRHELPGTIFDYKPDLSGLGVFFLVENRYGETGEIYRYFPLVLLQPGKGMDRLRGR